MSEVSVCVRACVSTITYPIWLCCTSLCITSNVPLFLPHSNLGWLYYGCLKSDQTIILVNIIGALLQILYILMYFRYTKVKVSRFLPSACACGHVWVSFPVTRNLFFVFQNLVGAQTLIAGIILLCGWMYFSMFLPEGETQLSQLGFTCSVVTVSMYLSPLSSLVRENPRSRKAV